MASRRSLAVALSKLEIFTTPQIMLEQYPTDSDVAADMLWHAFMENSLQGKKVVDLGAGTGILAIGAALLGADVIAVEKDPAAVDIMKRNQDIAGTDIKFVPGDMAGFSMKADVVIMNPPFGTKEKHADRAFLMKAFTLAPIIYTIHKSSTLPFLKGIIAEHGYRFAWQEERQFPLPKSMEHHQKRREYVDVVILCLKRD